MERISSDEIEQIKKFLETGLSVTPYIRYAVAPDFTKLNFNKPNGPVTVTFREYFVITQKILRGDFCVYGRRVARSLDGSIEIFGKEIFQERIPIGDYRLMNAVFDKWVE